MERFKVSRKELSNDPYRPIYHFVNPEGNLNDPNGFSFWNGNWHLFYQVYPPEDPRQHWGHAVSKDLVHWRDLPLAIYPNPERASYSGSALVEEDRVIAHYHGTEVGNLVAVSDDPLLLNWEKLTGKAVIPMMNRDSVLFDGEPDPHHVYDPFIWKKNGTYYSISGWRDRHETSNRLYATAELYKSTDLENWEYVHPFVEGAELFTMPDDDLACPYFLPIGDRYILLFFSHFSGGQYMLGDYDTERDKFIPTSHGFLNHGPVRPGGVHAPSATADGNGGVINIFNINAPRINPSEGWNQIMSSPMRLTLSDSNELDIEPAGDFESLRYDHQTTGKMTLPANEEIVLDKISGNAMEIKAEIDLQNAQYVELNVLRSPDKQEYTRITLYNRTGFTERDTGRQNSMLTIDSGNSSVRSDVQARPPENAPLYLEEDENLKLRIFIDKSVVEVYANGKQYAAVRVYPGLEESTGVSIRSQGQDSELIYLDAWQMQNTWDITIDEWKENPVWQAED
ncbi:MAG TPA: glycoside hydrolase family 32 protein [Balneolaceae bacterium]|nr:glycoside hydrolase family 32 protein [Balneolaceae bacterium]